MFKIASLRIRAPTSQFPFFQFEPLVTVATPMQILEGPDDSGRVSDAVFSIALITLALHASDHKRSMKQQVSKRRQNTDRLLVQLENPFRVMVLLDVTTGLDKPHLREARF